MSVKHANITVMYLDDEEINLYIFSANFKEKFNVITCISPAIALQELDKNKDEIIAVISDMRMPEMTGLEFIEKAKAINPNIFYYVLTGFDFNAEVNDALNKNLIQKSFTKPFDAKEIEGEILNVAKTFGKI